MATWVTHLMIADGVLLALPSLDKRGFCVGNIAPDCNVENADWTAYTPSRQVTHWMQGTRKVAADCDAFCEEYILKRKAEIKSSEEYSFLLGYYCHLITDAAFTAMIRDPDRVNAMWERIKADKRIDSSCEELPKTWDSMRDIIPKSERMGEIYSFEAEYLDSHPNSGYLTEILPLREFPDYIDYLPHGCIVRKIGIMGYRPQIDSSVKFISLSRREYGEFVENTVQLVVRQFKDKQLI